MALRQLTGQQLIDRWAGWIRGFVYCTPEQSTLLALWCLHTWIYEQFAATPYLSVTACTMRAGKTTALKVAKLLCRGAEEETTIRAISMAKKVEALEGKCTIMWDEAEKMRSEKLDETRTIIATGYQEGAQHSITMPGKTEVSQDGSVVTVPARIERFRVYCPKLFASIGDIQPILRDRSIVFDLLRGKPARSFTFEREQAKAEAAELIREWIEWFRNAGVRRIPAVDPTWLESSRDRELWTPIFSLASLLQLDKRTIDGLVGLSVDIGCLKQGPIRIGTRDDEVDAEERGMSERLLRDAISVFHPSETRLPSEVIIERLRAIPVAPWRKWRGDGLNAINLAALLSRFGIQPKVYAKPRSKTTAGETRTLRGYELATLKAVKL